MVIDIDGGVVTVSGEEYEAEAHQALRTLLGEDLSQARAMIASLHGARVPGMPLTHAVVYHDGAVTVHMAMTPGEVASAAASLARALAMVGGLRGAAAMLAGFMGADAGFGAADETGEP